jgi:5-dehydro-2-deoxygluconokinase
MRQRPLELICIGRAAVDLYGEQIGGRLEDMRSFAKYLGGSPANTSVGASRLGLRSAMLTRVGDEHNGRFVRERLAAEGVDVSQVRTDPSRLTALVFLGIRDRDTFPLVFYRDQCADMALCADDVDEDFIASSGAVLLSGTHLSQPGAFAACERAMTLARKHGARVVLDIDYRPVLWGLTSPGLGEKRYVASPEVSARLQAVLAQCDLIVGTEEEIHIAGGSDDTMAALRRLRALSRATLVVKRGPMGCAVFDGTIPATLDDGIAGPGFPVEVFNVLGAGDAFMAGFLRGWLREEPLVTCCRYANACGAIVVSRHGCAPAMASWTELQHFLAHGSAHHRLREDERLEHLHRATTRLTPTHELAVLAFDHRVQFEEIAGTGAQAASRIAAFKALVARAARVAASEDPRPGIIVDDRYGDEVLPPMTGDGWWVARPVELPGSRPLRFEAGPQVALTLRSWPTEHVAKCLVSLHPDDEPALRDRQLEQLCALQLACVASDREFLVEVIAPRDLPSDDSTLARAIEQIYDAGVRPDWWKLPPPETDAAWTQLADVITRHDPHCRGVLLLGLEASEAALGESFTLAAPHALCKGFAVGRSIFAESAAAWFKGEISDDEVVADVAARYERLIRLWRKARASTALAA